MTEEEIIKKLEDESGLSFEKGEFGFISGKMHPFMEVKEMQSASNIGGYEIWMKRLDEEQNNIYRRLYLQTPVEQTWDIVIPFLTYKQEDFTKLLEDKGFFTIRTE